MLIALEYVKRAGKWFCVIIITLIFVKIITVGNWEFKNPQKTVVVVAKKEVVNEHTEPGKWSRPFAPEEVEGVSFVSDRLWRLSLRNPDTNEIKIKTENLPNDTIVKPWNAVTIEFYSESQSLLIKVAKN